MVHLFYQFLLSQVSWYWKWIKLQDTFHLSTQSKAYGRILDPKEDANNTAQNDFQKSGHRFGIMSSNMMRLQGSLMATIIHSECFFILILVRITNQRRNSVTILQTSRIMRVGIRSLSKESWLTRYLAFCDESIHAVSTIYK